MNKIAVIYHLIIQYACTGSFEPTAPAAGACFYGIIPQPDNL